MAKETNKELLKRLGKSLCMQAYTIHHHEGYGQRGIFEELAGFKDQWEVGRAIKAYEEELKKDCCIK